MSRMSNRSQRLGLCFALMFMLIPAIEVASMPAPQQSYQLGPNDVVRIQVYGEDDLNVERKIDGDGNINFPLLGIIPVAGKTLQELQEYLTTRLAEGYVRMPKVTAYVSKNRNFYLTGEVKAPGGYPYEEGLTVHRAIAMAGGLTEKAERDTLRILRHTGGQEQTLPVKLDTLVLPDDIIVVAEGQRFYISGEVKTPGRYLYERALTVHKALSLAGGRTEKGDKGIIKVTRVVEGLAHTVPVTPEAPVLPDDILVVEPQDYKFYASGELKTPGGYPYKEGLTVHRAIAMAGGLTEKAERDTLRVLRHTGNQQESLPVQLDTPVLPDDIIVVAEGQRFYISGEVKTAGRYLCEKGMTVYKAISVAGGFTERGEKGTIKVTRITEGLAKTMVVSSDAAVQPDDIIVVEPQNHKFYTSGEVKNPGGYPYKEGLTVHQAISLAGGLTEKAERNELRVLRPTTGQEESLPVKLDTPVLPNDIILVAETQRFYVSGEIKTPGRYLYEKGLTIHKAISMAGGVTEKAETREMRVTRAIGGRAETIAVNPNAPVLPEDFIIVERLQKVYVNGEVKKPGDYPYEKNITLHKVITMAGGFTDKASESRTKVLRVIDGHEQSIRLKLEDVVLPEDIIVVPRSFF